MKVEGLGKHVLIAFGLALGIYLAAFAVDNYLRHKSGPWQVTFVPETNGAPAIVIESSKFAGKSQVIIFQGETVTNQGQTLAFENPKQSIPFGVLQYHDLTILPGALTFDFFGHEVEMLPRVLVVNQKQIPWLAQNPLYLHPTNKIPGLTAPVPKKKSPLK